jgi:xylulokinase
MSKDSTQSSPSGSASGDCILAVDHGTSGLKVALVTVDGRVLGVEFEPTPVAFLPGGGAEQDAEDWWRALIVAARRLMARGLVSRSSVLAVACSSTFSTTVACDAEGGPVGPALTWMDHRGAPYVRRVMDGWPSVKGYGLVRSLDWMRRSGGAPTLSGKDDAAHVLFWREERPEIHRNARWFLGSKDWLNLRLTGRCAASPDSVTLFWATDNRDIHNVRWDDVLLGRLGLDRNKLPDLRPSTDVLGPLQDDVADALGVARGTPVIVGSADLQSACVGSGAVDDFAGHVYIGTSSWVLCHVPFRKTDPLHTIAALPSAIPGRYFCANEQDMAGGALAAALRNLLRTPGEPRAAVVSPEAYLRADAVVEAVPPGARGVLFTPWLNGEKTPVDDECLRGGFHNVSVETTSEDMLRAVYEGVAYNTKWSLGYVERFVGRRLDPLNAIGGGAQSDAWCRILADVTGRTIRQVEDPREANARGAAFLAAVALGRLRFTDIPGCMRFAKTFAPDPANRPVYDRGMRAFQDLWRRNKGFYRWWNHADPA